jgi:type I restriction enzyme S subunit
MNNWPHVRLQEIVSFKTGKLDSNAAEANGIYPFFTCSPETLRINSYAFDTTAILLAGNNATGVFPVKYHSGKFNCYQRTYVIENIAPQAANLSYLYFAIQLQLKFLQSMSVGAATKFLTMRILNNLKIPLPPLSIQQKIAGILTAHDDLIENNLKRIKLLEEMAQITYEEWFVRLRFPGHESTPINLETDLPEGWEKHSLSQIGEYLNGYAFKPKDLGDEGMPIIKIKEIKGGVVKDTPRNTGEKIPEKYLVETGQILFSWSASLEVVVWQYERGLLNQHLFKVTPKKGVSKAFLFLALKDALKVFDGLTTGATMKHIKRKELDFVRTAVPDNRVMQEFDVLVGAVIEEILNLSKQNQRLREARDILLPRLIAGVIDVEKYDPAQLLKEAA